MTSNLNVAEIDGLSIFDRNMPTQSAIYALENQLLQMPQVDLDPVHLIIPGVMYARGLFMPKGSCVTGKIHINEHIVIIAYGDVTVTTNDGRERYTGHTSFVGKAGSKRALLMHEDTFWWAIHATKALTVEDAIQELVTNKPEDIRLENSKCLTS